MTFTIVTFIFLCISVGILIRAQSIHNYRLRLIDWIYSNTFEESIDRKHVLAKWTSDQMMFMPFKWTFKQFYPEAE